MDLDRDVQQHLKDARLAASDCISKMKQQNEQLMKSYKASNPKNYQDIDDGPKYDPYKRLHGTVSEPILRPTNNRVKLRKDDKSSKQSLLSDDYLDPTLPISHEEKMDWEDHRGHYGINARTSGPSNSSYQKHYAVKDDGMTHVLSAEYLDPSLPISHQSLAKNNKRTKKNVSKQPVAGRKSDPNRDGFEQIYSKESMPQPTSIYKDQYPAYGFLERTRPRPVLSAPLNVLSGESLDPAYIAADEHDRMKEVKKSAHRANLPTAGKKIDSNRDDVKKVFVNSYDEMPHGQSVARVDYPAWGNIERVKSSKPVHSSSILPYDGDYIMESENQHNYRDMKDTANHVPAGRASTRLPGEGVETMYQHDVPSHQRSSVYRDEYPAWGEQERNRPVPPSSTPLNLFQHNDDEDLVSTEEKHDDYDLPAAGKMNAARDAWKVGGVDHDDRIKSSEYHEMYQAYEGFERVKSYHPVSNSAASLGFDDKLPCDSQYLSSDNRHTADMKIAGKSSQKPIFDVNESLKAGSHDEMKTSEYKGKYTDFSDFERVKPYLPSHQSAFTVSQEIHVPWNSEYNASYMSIEPHPDSHQVHAIAGKPSNPSLHPMSELIGGNGKNSTSEYKKKYVGFHEVDRVKPANTMLKDTLTVNQGYASKWGSEYDDKFQQSANQLVTSDIAGKPSIISSGVMTADPAVINAAPNKSEYRDQYKDGQNHEVSPAKSNHTMTRVDTKEVIFPSTSDKLSSYETEYRQNFTSHPEALEESYKTVIINDHDRDHIELVDASATNDIGSAKKKSQSEYQERYIAWDIASMTLNDKVHASDSRRDNMSVTMTMSLPMTWKSEYDGQYTNKDPTHVQSMMVAGKPRAKVSTLSLSSAAHDDEVNHKEFKSEYAEKFASSPQPHPSTTELRVSPLSTTTDMARLLSSGDIQPQQWKSEQQVQYGRHNDDTLTSSTSSFIAGKKSFSHGKLPMQFAWKTLAPDAKTETEYASRFTNPVLGPGEAEANAAMISMIKAKNTSTIPATDSILTSAWQSEYDAKCIELRDKLNDIRTHIHTSSQPSIAGKPTVVESNLPTNFAWTSNPVSLPKGSSDTVTCKANLTRSASSTEYRDNFIQRLPYDHHDGVEKHIKAPRESVSELMTLTAADAGDVPTSFVSEYNKQYVDYSDMDLPPAFPLAKSSTIKVEDKIADIIRAPETTTSSSSSMGKILKQSNESRFTTEYNARYLSYPSSDLTLKKADQVSPPAPPMTTFKESSQLLLNTSPKVGIESSSLLEDTSMKKRMKNPFQMSENRGHFAWSANAKLSSKRGRDYVGKMASALTTGAGKTGNLATTTGTMMSTDSLQAKNYASSDHNDLSMLSSVSTTPNKKLVSIPSPTSTQRSHMLNCEAFGSATTGMMKKLSSEGSRHHQRPQTAPTKRSLQRNDSNNILFSNPRYPQLFDTTGNRWMTESQSSFTWKK